MDDLAAALVSAAQSQPTGDEAGTEQQPQPQPQLYDATDATVLIHDGTSPSSSGSRSLLRHLLLRCLLHSSTRPIVVLSLLFPASHTQRVIQQAVDGSEAPSPALRGLEAAAQRKLRIIDAFSQLSLDDGDLPLASFSTSSSTPPPSKPSCVQRVELCTTLSLPVLEAAIRALAEGGCVLFVDGLSSLLFHHPPFAVLAWLVSLRALPSTSLVLHADAAVPQQLLFSPHALVALERLARTSLAVTEVRQEQLLTSPPQLRYHFTVTATRRGRRSGRLRSTAELWTLQPSAFLLSAADDERGASAASVDAVTSTLQQLLTSSSTPSAASPSTPQSSFNLSTSDRQRQAKAQLRLPYQHTGSLAVSFGEAGLQLTKQHSQQQQQQQQQHHGDDDDDVLDDDEEDDDDLDI